MNENSRVGRKKFKGNKPISWHKIDKDYVYNNLAGKTMTIYNEDGSIERISFARLNRRVKSVTNIPDTLKFIVK